MDLLISIVILFVLGLLLARRGTGGLEQIQNAPYAEHQIPTFEAPHDPPAHH